MRPVDVRTRNNVVAIAPPEVGAFVHAAIPGSRLVTLDATGRCPQLSAPDATSEAIAAFVAASGDGRGRTGPAGRAARGSADDLYEHAPRGYLSTLSDGRIVRINSTLLGRLGRAREDVVWAMRFTDLLTAGGRIYYETHFAPLLSMQGDLGGVALELQEYVTALAPTTATVVVAALRDLLEGFGDGLDDDTALLALSVPAGRASAG
jgi:hypothetical protein